MPNKLHNYLLIFTFLALPSASFGQSNAAKELEQKVYYFNNQLEYSTSHRLIQDFLSKNANNNENKYWGFLYLSYTYKRLYDYGSTIQYLDSAFYYGLRTNKVAYFTNNIICQKALAYFDKQDYAQARSLITILEINDYKYIDDEYRSKLMIVAAHYYLKERKFKEAETLYDRSFEKMKIHSPCDLPLVYANYMILYATTNQKSKLLDSYNDAIACATKCDIKKYIIYTNHMMSLACEAMKDYKDAIKYYKVYDSLNTIYNNLEHLNTLASLEKNIQLQAKNLQLKLRKEEINQKNIYIYSLLIIAFLLVGILFFGYFFVRYRRQKNEAKMQLYFAQKMLEQNEAERGRIAGDLHDGISHELMALKKEVVDMHPKVSHKIDQIIEDIRHISRDLHPIVLDKIGLKYTIINLCERYMENEQLHITYDINYDKQLSKYAELQLYRIIQEVLTNAEKHAKAYAVQIQINAYHNLLKVIVEDNGVGFDLQEKLSNKNSFGIHNIIERTKVIGGKASINSSSNGTIIKLDINY